MSPLARRSDPITSHMAAANATEFKGGHAARILACLQAGGPATAHELADQTGLTVVQIDRRLPELARSGKVHVCSVNGAPQIRAGARVWEAV